MSSGLQVLFNSFIQSVFDEIKMNVSDSLTFTILSCQQVSKQSPNASESEFRLKYYATNYADVTMHIALSADLYEPDTIANYSWTKTRSWIPFRAVCWRCTVTSN